MGDVRMQGGGNLWHLRLKMKEMKSSYPKEEARQGFALTFILTVLLDKIHPEQTLACTQLSFMLSESLIGSNKIKSCFPLWHVSVLFLCYLEALDNIKADLPFSGQLHSK